MPRIRSSFCRSSLNLRVLRRRAESVVVDPQGEGLGLDQPVLDDHRVHGRLHPQGPAYGPEEVLRVVERVEPGQVRAQDAPHEGLPPRPGHQPKDLEGWKRDVQEEPDVGVREPLADHARQQHQVVVVDPDQIGRPKHLGHLFEKQLMGLVVGLEVRRVEVGQQGKVVEQRPDHVVAEAAVVLVVEPLLDMDGYQLESAHLFLHLGQFLRRVVGLADPHDLPARDRPMPSAFSARARTADTRPPAFRTTLFL